MAKQSPLESLKKTKPEPLKVDLPKPQHPLKREPIPSRRRRRRIQQARKRVTKSRMWTRGKPLPRNKEGQIDYERIPWHVGLPLRMVEPWIDKAWEADDGTTDYAQMPWSEVLSKGYQNFGSSVTQNMKDMYTFLKTPLKSAAMLGELGRQGSAVAASGLMKHFLNYDDEVYNLMFKDPESQLFDMVVEVYKANYSLDDNQAGLKRYIAEEPASFAEDVSMLATFFLAGSGVGTARMGGAMSKAFKLTPYQKSLLKFNRYLNDQVSATGRAVSGVSNFLKESVPDALKWYGDRALYIGVGASGQGYAPGYWAKVAHLSLNYMDPSAWPLLPIDAVGGAIRFTQGDVTNAVKFDDSIDEFAEYLHSNFDGDVIESEVDFKQFVQKAHKKYQQDVDLAEAVQFLGWMAGKEPMNLRRPGIAEHATETRYLSNIYRDGRLRTSGDLPHGENPDGEYVYLSNGKFYRNAGSRSVGFVFDPKTIMGKYEGAFSDKWPRAHTQAEYDAAIPDDPEPGWTYLPDADAQLERIRQIEEGDWENVPEGLEFRVQGDLQLEDAIGVIENGNVIMLDEGSLGRPPSEWIFEDGRSIIEIAGHGDAIQSLSGRATSIGELSLGSVAEARYALIHYLPDNRLAEVIGRSIDDVVSDKDLYRNWFRAGWANFETIREAVDAKQWDHPSLDPLYNHIFFNRNPRYWLNQYGEFPLTPDQKMEMMTPEAIANRAKNRTYGVELEFLAEESATYTHADISLESGEDVRDAFTQYIPHVQLEMYVEEALLWNADAYDGIKYDHAEDLIAEHNWGSPFLQNLWDYIYSDMSPDSILSEYGTSDMPRQLSMAEIAGKHEGHYKGDSSLEEGIDSATGEYVEGTDFEIATRKYKGDVGFQKIRELIADIEQAGGKVNDSTGLHVHVGKDDLSVEQIANITRAWGKYEWAIDQLYAEWRRGNEGFSASIYDLGPDPDFADVPSEVGDGIQISKYKLREAIEFIETKGGLQEALQAIQPYERRVFDTKSFTDFMDEVEESVKEFTDHVVGGLDYNNAFYYQVRGAITYLADYNPDKLRSAFSLPNAMKAPEMKLTAQNMAFAHITTRRIAPVIDISGAATPFDERRFLDFISISDGHIEKLKQVDRFSDTQELQERYRSLLHEIGSMPMSDLRATFSFRDTDMSFNDMMTKADEMIKKYVFEDDLHGAAFIAGAAEYDALAKFKKFVEDHGSDKDKILDRISEMEKQEIQELLLLGPRMIRKELLERAEKMVDYAVQDKWDFVELFADVGFKLDGNSDFRFQSYNEAAETLKLADRERTTLYQPWEEWLDDLMDKKVDLGDASTTYGDGIDANISGLVGRRKLNVRGTGAGGITIEFRAHEGTLDGDKIENYVTFLLNFVERFKDERVRPTPRIGTGENVLETLMPGEPASAWHLIGTDIAEYKANMTTAQQNMYDMIKDSEDGGLDIDNPEQLKWMWQQYEDNAIGQELFEYNDAESLKKLVDDTVELIKNEPGRPHVVQERVRQLNVSLNRGDSVGIIGKTVASPQEFAAMAQFLRNPSKERTWIVYLKDKRIVEHEAMTLNSAAETVAPNPIMLEERLDQFDADEFVMVHNHPGGVAEFSDADRVIATRYESILGVKFRGSVVIDSGTYAHRWRNRYGVMHGDVENEQLPSSLVGWDTNSPYHNAGFRETQRTRRDDPLYQTIVDDPETLAKWEEVLSGAEGRDGEVSLRKYQESILGFSQYLKTRKNWIVLGYMGEGGRLDSLVEYQGLHELTAQELHQFMKKRADMFGGSQVNVFIGEGDWYANVDEALQPFNEMDGIASVSVGSENYTKVPAESGWGDSWGTSDPNMVEELFRSFGDESETGLKPLVKFGDKVPAGTGNMSKVQFDEAMRTGKVSVGGKVLGRSPADKRLMEDAEHVTSDRDSYSGIQSDESVQSADYQGEQGNLTLNLDDMAGDRSRVFLHYGKGFRKKGSYGFIFDPVTLVDKLNASVSYDLLGDYQFKLPDIIKEIAIADGLDFNDNYIASLADYIGGDYRGLPAYDKDPDFNIEQWALDISDEVSDKLHDFASSQRLTGQQAINRLREGGNRLGYPLEITVQGEIPLEYAIGVIEDGEVRYLAEESVGKHPSQWVFDGEELDTLIEEWVDYGNEPEVSRIVGSLNMIPEDIMLEHVMKRIESMESDNYNMENVKGIIEIEGIYSTAPAMLEIWLNFLDDEPYTGLLQELTEYWKGRDFRKESNLPAASGNQADNLKRPWRRAPDKSRFYRHLSPELRSKIENWDADPNIFYRLPVSENEDLLTQQSSVMIQPDGLKNADIDSQAEYVEWVKDNFRGDERDYLLKMKYSMEDFMGISRPVLKADGVYAWSTLADMIRYNLDFTDPGGEPWGNINSGLMVFEGDIVSTDTMHREMFPDSGGGMTGQLPYRGEIRLGAEGDIVKPTRLLETIERKDALLGENVSKILDSVSPLSKDTPVYIQHLTHKDSFDEIMSSDGTIRSANAIGIGGENTHIGGIHAGEGNYVFFSEMDDPSFVTLIRHEDGTMLPQQNYGFMIDASEAINDMSGMIGENLVDIQEKAFMDALGEYRTRNNLSEDDAMYLVEELAELRENHPNFQELQERTLELLENEMDGLRVSGQEAISGLGHLSGHEIVVPDKVDYRAIRGVIINHEKKWLTPDSIGKPPDQWKYQDTPPTTLTPSTRNTSTTSTKMSDLLLGTVDKQKSGRIPMTFAEYTRNNSEKMNYDDDRIFDAWANEMEEIAREKGMTGSEISKFIRSYLR